MWSGSPLSSNLRVEVCRFIPSFAAHAAVAFEADPHQIRSRNPSEYGSRRRSPGGLGNIGRGFGRAKQLKKLLGVPPAHRGIVLAFLRAEAKIAPTVDD